MKLSVTILSYSTRKLTLSCLKSLDKYPLSEKFEVIVIDNSSSDNSVLEVKKFRPQNYRLSLIENKSNKGFARANNQGIKKAKGKYILLLNSDTLVTKNVLNDLVAFAESHPDVGVVGPKLLNTDGSSQPSVFRLPTLARAFKQYILRAGKVLDKYAPNAKRPVEVESVVGAAFLITPVARIKVGLLNERYFMYFEDLDYCRRVRKAGLKVFYLPSTEITHIHGASGKISSTQSERLIQSSKIYHGAFKYYVLTTIIKLGARINPTTSALLFAILGALGIRFLHFPDNIYFAYDQARDAFMAQEILMGDLKIIGPPASISGLFHGPVYWYLIAPFYFLSSSPIIAATFIRIFNVLSVVLIYLIGKSLLSRKVGLIAALVYAFSFENWQEALYFTNPGPAVITTLIFYYALAKIAKHRDKAIDWFFLALGLGLSIQLQFYLVYLVVPFVATALLFPKKILKGVSSKKIFVFALGILVALSTFIISELRFEARATRGVLEIFDKKEESLVFADKLSQWLDKVVLTIGDSLGLSLFNLPKVFFVLAFIVFIAAFFVKGGKQTREALKILLVWILSTSPLYLVAGHNTYYIIGLGPVLVLLFAVFANEIKSTSIQQLFIGVVVTMNLIMVFGQARDGIVIQISVQEGMRYGDEKRLVDYIYKDSGDSESVVSALTMPYDIYTTWAYLFEYYGREKYGYVPYWVKEAVTGYPGRLPVSTKTICDRYTIYESTRGIEHLEAGFRKEQDLTTVLIDTVRIGSFSVEKRFDKACI
jgi:hypothetical protein